MRFVKIGAVAVAIAVIGAHVAWGVAWGKDRPAVLLATYTHNKGGAARLDVEKAKVVKVRLSGDFSAKEQADIADAIVEWNHTLNGYLRFERDDSGDRSGLTIVRVPDKGLPLNGPTAQRLAATMRGRDDGGAIVVYGDRIGTYDLRRIVLHEIGHLLGLEHDERSDLMFPRYFHSRQACIDRATVEMLAAQRSWQIEKMNWCGTTMASPNQKFDGGGDPNLHPRTGQERRQTRGAPGLHEPPATEDAEVLAGIACPHGSDQDDADRLWWESVLSGAFHGERVGLNR